ncbi:MAG: tetratricopeptide repeat protein [Vicingaceae bacterium]
MSQAVSGRFKPIKRRSKTPSKRVLKRIDDLLHDALEVRVKDVDMSIHQASDALMMAESIEDKDRIARANNYLGLFYMITGNNPQSLVFAEKARAHYARKKNTPGEAFALYTMGSVHYKTANHEKGLEMLFDSLKIWEEVGDQFNESRTLKAIGYIFEIFDDYDNAIKNYLKCLEISREIEDKNGESNACNPLSGIYLKQGKLDLADELIERSIQLKEETQDLRGMAFAYFGKGKVLFEQGLYQQAEEYLLKSLHLHFEMGERLGEGLAKRKLSQVYYLTGKLDRAEEFALMAIELARDIENEDIVYKAYLQLYLIAKTRGDIELSLSYYEKYHQVRERVLNMESSGKIKAREAIHHSQMARKEAEIARLKNIELKKAHDEIELKNKEITNSIRYAQRIQKAILPAVDRWNSEFPESFTMFLPKDHVSGDFYWMKRKGHKVWFACVDCTGHGVPGAMVSMVGYNGLNQLVDKMSLGSPAKILDNLCRFIKVAFRSEEVDINDGMDMSLCCFDRKNFTLHYAGANNSLVLIRGQQLIEYKANKQPVGNFENLQPFTNHQVDLIPGDRIYLSTDGYPDQFGGPKIKKFKTGNLKQLILDIQEHDMARQREVLMNSFYQWKGDHFQVDDVCLLGIELGKNE